MLIDRFRFVLHFGYHSLSVDPILRAADLCTHYLYNIAHVLTAAIFLTNHQLSCCQRESEFVFSCISAKLLTVTWANRVYCFSDDIEDKYIKPWIWSLDKGVMSRSRYVGFMESSYSEDWAGCCWRKTANNRPEVVRYHARWADCCVVPWRPHTLNGGCQEIGRRLQVHVSADPIDPSNRRRPCRLFLVTGKCLITHGLTCWCSGWDSGNTAENRVPLFADKVHRPNWMQICFISVSSDSAFPYLGQFPPLAIIGNPSRDLMSASSTSSTLYDITGETPSGYRVRLFLRWENAFTASWYRASSIHPLIL